MKYWQKVTSEATGQFATDYTLNNVWYTVFWITISMKGTNEAEPLKQM